MSWLYKSVEHTFDGETWFSVHREISNKDVEKLLSVDPVAPIGDTPEELIEDLEMMLKDCKRQLERESNAELG